MSDNSKLPREVFKIPSREGGNEHTWRLWCRRNVWFIKTAEFGLGLACAVGATSVGGDTYLVVFLLAAGFSLIAIGIIVSNLSLKHAVGWCMLVFIAFAAEFTFLYLHFISIKPEPIHDKKEIYGIRPLGNLTNSQLRERAMTFSQTIRDFAASFERAEMRISDEERAQRSNNQIPKNGNIDAWMKEARELYENQSNEQTMRGYTFRDDFMIKYRVDSIIIADELKLRLGGMLPDLPSTRTHNAIKTTQWHIMLDAPGSISYRTVLAGSDAFEYWAKQLP